jgi:hypothetical protein
MRAIDYFASFAESVSIVRALTTEGIRIIVEPQLSDTPEATTFEVVDDALVSILERAPVFYLAGSFTRFGVAFLQLKEGIAKGKYSIDPLTQGPILKGLASRINLVEGTERLLPGRFSYQKSYRNPNTNEWEKPSAEVRTAFRRIVAIVKEHCPSFLYKPETEIFIAPEARARLQAGAVHIVENQIVPGGMS